MMKVLNLILLVSLFSSNLYSQAIINNIQKKADYLYKNYAFSDAINLYENALEKKSQNDYIKLKLAECYGKLNDPKHEAIWYNAVNKGKTVKLSPTQQTLFAEALHQNGQYSEAKTWYLQSQQINKSSIKINKNLESLDQIDAYYLNGSNYEINFMDINTRASEFSPTQYRDGVVFVTSRTQNDDNRDTPLYKWDNQPFLNLYYTPSLSSEITDSEIFKYVNSDYHEGPAIFYDNFNKVIFTRNNYKAKKLLSNNQHINQLGLYNAEVDSITGIWENITPVNLNSIDYSVGHPAITEDGKILFFASNMPGGFGGTDIYKSVKIGNLWQEPVNLGPSVNTDGNEEFPYLYQDSVLFFASDGLGGLGGLDVFKIPFEVENSKAENLGFPINSNNDDFGVLMVDDQKGYVSSNRDSKYPGDNIYAFEYKKTKPDSDTLAGKEVEETKKILKLIGTVRSKDNIILSDVTITITDVNQGKNLRLKSNWEGKYTSELPPNTTYWVKAEKPDFFTYSGQIDVSDISNGIIYNDIFLDEIIVGKSITLENIYYDYDSDTINESSAKELDKLVELLQDNPEMKIELSSHTDSRGTNKYNLTLSQKRAKSAAEYIINNGINKKRIRAVGYGENKMVFPCGDEVDCTDEFHELNRRTEFTVIKN